MGRIPKKGYYETYVNEPEVNNEETAAEKVETSSDNNNNDNKEKE